jgi:hypothetical protein
MQPQGHVQVGVLYLLILLWCGAWGDCTIVLVREILTIRNQNIRNMHLHGQACMQSLPYECDLILYRELL